MLQESKVLKSDVDGIDANLFHLSDGATLYESESDLSGMTKSSAISATPTAAISNRERKAVSNLSPQNRYVSSNPICAKRV
jgi:hypothetical protein